MTLITSGDGVVNDTRTEIHKAIAKLAAKYKCDIREYSSYGEVSDDKHISVLVVGQSKTDPDPFKVEFGGSTNGEAIKDFARKFLVGISK